MINPPVEKMGSFFLGAEYDLSTGTLTNNMVNYDARDLCTHAVCVGMTGSGKTGLCIGLLEEAAIDKVPAIIIDPKGDMTNLLLQFENLSPTDFEKWINADDASRKGMTTSEYARSVAEMWEKGLGEWGQGKDRIRLLKQSVDYTIYTPGSDMGMPINIMGSFAAPKISFEEDSEMLFERIEGTVAALLGMIESKADPSRSKEGILISKLFEHYWRKGEDLDLGKLILGIQNPPFSKLGVFDLETFFPAKSRLGLAMEFNGLVASPSFQYWLKGDPLDIDKIYFTAEGKPRHSIFYIAHLSDHERMFFVTLLLNSLITWMRKQSGTTSLRSLVYFDEIFGYFPPTAQPPSKKPLLTIMKQGRAYGLGAILVTQNPVDIDYKGLSNAGTWFIGKMQAERDKLRVLSGLEGAIAEAGGTANSDFDKIITSLSSRKFLLHNVHEGAPVVFNTRWAMSYLRGPMTRPQIKELMAAKRKGGNTSRSMSAMSAPVSTYEETGPSIATPPSVDPDLNQKFFAVWKSEREAQSELVSSDALKLVYKPMALAAGSVRFYNAKRNVDEIKDVSYIFPAPDKFGRLNEDEVQEIKDWERILNKLPDHPDSIPVSYLDLPDSFNTGKELAKVKKEFGEWLYKSNAILIHEHTKLKLVQDYGETLEAFVQRVQHAAKEVRDDEIDELKDKYDDKKERIEDKIRKEEQDLDQAESDKSSRRRAEIVGVAETIFSVFVKRRSRSLSSAQSKSRMRRKAAEKVRESKEDLAELEQDYEDLLNELEDKISDITKEWDVIATNIVPKEIKPRKSDIQVDTAFLVWQPFWVANNGASISAVE